MVEVIELERLPAARPVERFYGKVAEQRLLHTPMSDAFENIEHRITGVLFDDTGNPTFEMDRANPEREEFERAVKGNMPRKIIQASLVDGKQMVFASQRTVSAQVGSMIAQVIPPDVEAAYRLCEYYWASEGDVRMTIQIPMEVAVRPITVTHESKDLAKEIGTLFGPNYLDLDATLADMWLSRDLYGVAYPFEVWDHRVPDKAGINAIARGQKAPFKASPQTVQCLNPKYIYCGRNPFDGSLYMAMSPDGPEGQQFRQQIMMEQVPPMTYNALANDIHEHMLWAWNVWLAPGSCTPVRDLANSFIRYPWPSLMPTFRTLSTRQILEEMIRASIEGTRNQLWAFLLGDAGNRPTADEVRALSATVTGMSGKRTGALVWGGHLRVEVIAPKIEEALANEKHQRLTEHFFRQRGVSMRVVSGEGTSTGGSGGDLNTDGVDVKIMIERATYARGQMNRWLAQYVRKVLLLSGDNAMIKLAMNDNCPLVQMGDFGLEQAAQIKDSIIPLYGSGLMSPQTATRKAGMDYDQELSNHTDADKEAFQPPSVFAQSVVKTSDGGDGAPKKTTSKQTGANGTAPATKPKKASA